MTIIDRSISIFCLKGINNKHQSRNRLCWLIPFGEKIYNPLNSIVINRLRRITTSSLLLSLIAFGKWQCLLDGTACTQRFIFNRGAEMQRRKVFPQKLNDWFAHVSQRKNKMLNTLLMQMVDDISKKRLTIYRCHALGQIRHHGPEPCTQTAS